MCPDDRYALPIGLSAIQRRVLLDRQFELDLLVVCGGSSILADVRCRKCMLSNTELSRSHSFYGRVGCMRWVAWLERTSSQSRQMRDTWNRPPDSSAYASIYRDFSLIVSISGDMNAMHPHSNSAEAQDRVVAAMSAAQP
jgi:hypothetical protein